jgi:hypothetical protein
MSDMDNLVALAISYGHSRAGELPLELWPTVLIEKVTANCPCRANGTNIPLAPQAPMHRT